MRARISSDDLLYVFSRSTDGITTTCYCSLRLWIFYYGHSTFWSGAWSVVRGSEGALVSVNMTECTSRYTCNNTGKYGKMFYDPQKVMS